MNGVNKIDVAFPGKHNGKRFHLCRCDSCGSFKHVLHITVILNMRNINEFVAELERALMLMPLQPRVQYLGYRDKQGRSFDKSCIIDCTVTIMGYRH